MSSEDHGTTKFSPSPGNIRPSQLITTFGPGSIIQTEHDSVLVLGIDFWKNPNEDAFIPKNHLLLQKITKKRLFLMPAQKESSHQSIACISFPKWGYCSLSNCAWLQPHKEVPNDAEGFFCRDHPNKPLLPARLIMVCERGHLDEFPWVEWTHSNPDNPLPICDSPKIRWKGGKFSGSMSNFRLQCDCGARRSMFGALDDKGLRLFDSSSGEFFTQKCQGKLPWLNKQEKCTVLSNNSSSDETSANIDTAIPRGLIVRATSLYYSKVIRGITIPALAHPIAKYLQSEKYQNHMEIPMFRDASDQEKAKNILEMNKDWKMTYNYTENDVLDFMEKIRSREGQQNIETELDLKHIEYDDLINNENFDDEQTEKEIVINNVPLVHELKEIFQTVRRLDILTALEVQRYFSRLTPPGEINFYEKNSNDHIICSLEVRGKTKSGRTYEANSWLPCVIKKGEGIFLVFNENFIKKCINDGVEKRLNSLIDNHDEWEKISHFPSSIDVDKQYILLHSLSHLLIKELSLQSGYGEASISERIYSSKHMRGILIYTTSSGDGSLGGLVRQAQTGLLKIIKNSLRKSRTCSRDPICILETPQTKRERLPLALSLNGSACYGCLMLPETSCENFNKLLDRKILVDKDYGVEHVIFNE